MIEDLTGEVEGRADVEFLRPDILETDLRPDDDLDGVGDDGLRARLESNQQVLHRVCEYSRTLWGQLDEARHYLLDEVAGGEDGRARALLSDDKQWQAWAELFAQVSGALAGATGDSGFGRSEAILVARSHGVDVKPARRSP